MYPLLLPLSFFHWICLGSLVEKTFGVTTAGGSVGQEALYGSWASWSLYYVF
jgi:hypothetical protein